MRYRRLERAGLMASEIGFGTWGLGGNHGGAVGYGPTDDRESIRALRRALALGVSFYDTSDLYGHGHSEALLGRALADARRRVVIAAKAGFLEDGREQDFTPARLALALDESLKRLRTAYVDLFQLHSPAIDVLRSEPGIHRWLRDLQRGGKARAVGISVKSPDDGLIVAAQFEVAAIQVNFSLADQRAARCGLFKRCAEKGIGVIVRTPLCFGFLGGALGQQNYYDATDHRSHWTPEQRARWHEASLVFSRCRAAPSEETPAQFALRFCLSYPGVWTVIPGMLTAAEVEENVRASERGPLGREELEQVEDLYGRQGFFLGRKGVAPAVT